MCAVLGRKNLIASPFTSPLKTPLGWEEKWQVLEGVSFFLKCVLISRWFVVLNLPPLKRFRSRRNGRYWKVLVFLEVCAHI